MIMSLIADLKFVSENHVLSLASVVNRQVMQTLFCVHCRSSDCLGL